MKVGFVGWRGMVGSVLLERCQEEKDFEGIEVTLFSSSKQTFSIPHVGTTPGLLKDSYSIADLKENDVIISCQGGDYTKEMYLPLRESGWTGYWIDAASTLRLNQEARIALDPLNGSELHSAISDGIKTFVGGNCTVSLMLLALHGLLKEDLVESVNSATYQAISGAGAAQMSELLRQHEHLASLSIKNSSSSSITQDRLLLQEMKLSTFPTSAIGFPLAFNLLPFIDVPVEEGRSKEEWKGEVEARKILGENSSITVEGICVRVPVLRCHSQALTVVLKNELSTEEINEKIKNGNQWVTVIPNTPDDSKNALTPAAISNTLNIGIGRIRKSNLSSRTFHAFTVGDQLLWGAAEPLRRMFSILKRCSSK